MNIKKYVPLFIITIILLLFGCEINPDPVDGNPLGGSVRELKTDGQQLLYGLVAYSWSGMSSGNRKGLINQLVGNGWTGVNLELMERLAWWPNGDQTDNYVKTMKGKVDALVPWIQDCRDAGLWVYVVDINSNADVNRKLNSANELFEIADYINKKCSGYNNLIRLPVSETDSDLNPTFRRQYIDYVESTWPNELTSAMSNFRGNAKWAESHMSSVNTGSPKGSWRKFAVTDSATILIEMCGSVTGKKMNKDLAVRWVDSMLSGGNSVSLYALGTGVDSEIIREVGKIAKEKNI